MSAPMTKPKISDEQVAAYITHVKHFNLSTEERVMWPAGFPADLRDARAERDALAKQNEALKAERDEAVENAAREYFVDGCFLEKLAGDLAALQSRYDALLADRAGVSEAMVDTFRKAYAEAPTLSQSKLYLAASEIRFALEATLRAALASPIPAVSVNREAKTELMQKTHEFTIRAEALEEAAKIADAHKGSVLRERLGRRRQPDCGDALNASVRDEERGEDIASEIIAAAIRAAAKTEDAR